MMLALHIFFHIASSLFPPQQRKGVKILLWVPLCIKEFVADLLNSETDTFYAKNMDILYLTSHVFIKAAILISFSTGPF